MFKIINIHLKNLKFSRFNKQFDYKIHEEKREIVHLLRFRYLNELFNF